MMKSERYVQSCHRDGQWRSHSGLRRLLAAFRGGATCRRGAERGGRARNSVGSVSDFGNDAPWGGGGSAEMDRQRSIAKPERGLTDAR